MFIHGGGLIKEQHPARLFTFRAFQFNNICLSMRRRAWWTHLRPQALNSQVTHTDLPATRPLLEEYACVCVNVCTLAQPIISDYRCNLWVGVAKSRYINSEACCRARPAAGASWVKCWMDSPALDAGRSEFWSGRCAARLANEALGVQRGDLQYSCPLTKSKPAAGSRPKSGARLGGYNLEGQKCPCVCVCTRWE